LVGFMLGSHPRFGRLFNELLADGMHARVQERNRRGPVGAFHGSGRQFGKQLVKGFHATSLREQTAKPCRYRSPVSTIAVASAASTASAPLDSRDPSSPARAIACSSVSHVSRPYPTATA